MYAARTHTRPSWLVVDRISRRIYACRRSSFPIANPDGARASTCELLTGSRGQLDRAAPASLTNPLVAEGMQII